MAAFTAYFDAAGTSRRPILAVAGFVSDFRKWKRFEEEWQRILESESITCFHMTDFVSSEGEFKEWKGQSERRWKFIAELIECSKRNVNKAFATVVVVRAFSRVAAHYQLLERFGHPYAFCGHWCVSQVEKWRKKHKVKDLLYVFEDGDEGKGHLQRICKIDGIEPEFMNKKAAPLQAADLIAWRTRYAFDGALAKDLTKEDSDRLRATFDSVWKRFPHEAAFATTERLERYCELSHIPKR